MKAYLKVYVNYKQNDWVNWLSIVEFEINSIKSFFTKLESFLATKSYLSRSSFEVLKSITSTSSQRKKIKNVDKLIFKFTQLKNYLREELKWTQIKQKKQINRDRHSIFEFRVENMIMLDARYQIITRFNKILDYKNLNLFRVTRVIDNCVYELNLSKIIKNIHSMFYSWLLHVDDDVSREIQKNSKSNSIFTNSQEDVWLIDEILNFKINKRRKNSITKERDDCFKYKIRWTRNDQVNTTFNWHDFTNVNNVSYAIANYYHKYLNATKSHQSFVRSTNWTLFTTTNETQ